MAAIAAGRTEGKAARLTADDGTTLRPLRIIALDSARTLGAKILVAGGGRCNVTHHAVDVADYHGSTPGAIRTVLRRFSVTDTIEFFANLGVTLKREATGKLFPTTDSARTVLNALLGEAARVGVEVCHPWRVAGVERTGNGDEFVIRGETGELLARCVILATGGMALPKSGSDGHGYTIARGLGHTTTPRIFPALVPLTLAEGCFLRELAGLTLPATLEVRAASGKRLASRTGSVLCTHVGLSGPGVLDISREYLDALHNDPGVTLRANWAPSLNTESLDALLAERRTQSPARVLADPPANLPDRLSRVLCDQAGIDPKATGANLAREKRRALAALVTAMPLPVTGHRGFVAAEVTAGGVPLSELHLATMGSRACPGLHLCGEILDVDGRIGGFNFQWAWASGHVAGTAAAAALLGDQP